MEKDHIKNYWESQAKEHGESHWASWGDNWMIDLEIQTIGKHINNGDTVLDIGCANGYSTFNQMKSHAVSSIHGIDFSEGMIAAALQSKKQRKLSNEIQFSVGDVRNLEFFDNTFDVAYTTRVIINLPTWTEQMQAIKECIRVVKPGGTIVLSEGFWEPLVLLNSMRTLKNLPPLVEHDFNRYLKFSNLRSYLDNLEVSYEIDDFSSIYYLGSRFLRELVTDISLYPGFSNPINRIFYEIEKEFSGGGFGIQQAVVIKKKAASSAEFGIEARRKS